MKKLMILLACTVGASAVFAQEAPQADTSWKKEYRATATRINDLVHTRLEVKPDFSKSYLYGKAWVTLTPHFYTTDSVTLDAKGFTINKLALVKNTQQLPLKYSYDDLQLHIKLDKAYKAGEKYTLYIDYTAKPDEYDAKYGTADLLGIKGMFFINPKGEEKDKPTQIWTQGETESNSAWFPTIDKTNQKTTEELTVTVDNKYVTLSNGKLASQKKNADGTRTDYWKMDLPHAPYLFFLGVGDYAVIKDTWKGKEVNYYVEKEFAPVAKKIFGNTPEMMTFFSKITGVEFPWAKYSQITGRDYVAGAMENTTATIHQNTAQQDARQLVDGNMWEGTIAHELFHQWFGDLVTTESWSNLTLNESFADYSEQLWFEHKYGKDAGDEENYNAMMGYLRSSSSNLDLVRFYYPDKETMFDAVSYQKGGRVLNMLRNFVGDDAFFKSLNLYLTTNKFKSAEAHQLRLAFEEVTGRDLNWYFNQWYFSNGQPNVAIDYKYNDAAGKVDVIIKQTQNTGKLFQLPIAIDVYNGPDKMRHNVWVKNAVDTFTFTYTKRPDLVNVDGDKVILWAKRDNKTLENYIHQYTYAGNYTDRREAIDFASKHQDDARAVALIRKAVGDRYYSLRSFAINHIDMKSDKVRAELESVLLETAKNDKKPTVRADAIAALGEYKKPIYSDLFKNAINDSSYSVAGSALAAYAKINPEVALVLTKEMMKKPAKGDLAAAYTFVLATSGDESTFDKVLEDFTSQPLQNRFGAINNLSVFLGSLKNTEKFKKGIDELVNFRDNMPAAIKPQTDPYLNGQVLAGILEQKQTALKTDPTNAALKEQIAYVISKLPEDMKKGF